MLLHPNVAVSTARVYASPQLVLSRQKPFAGKTPALRQALRTIQAGDITGALFNRMEQAVFADHPHLASAKQRLLDGGCEAAAMSGSGATLFGLCGSRHKAIRVVDAITGERTSIVCSTPQCVERIQ